MMASGSRIQCVMTGCENSKTHLTLWKSRMCLVHNITYGELGCSCPPPFRLFPFPKNDNLCEKWTKLVNKEDKDNKPWKPKRYSCICSDHFVDGYPSLENPYPTCNLGHSVTVITMKRPTVVTSTSLLGSKKRKKAELQGDDTIGNTLPLASVVKNDCNVPSESGPKSQSLFGTRQKDTPVHISGSDYTWPSASVVNNDYNVPSESGPKSGGATSDASQSLFGTIQKDTPVPISGSDYTWPSASVVNNDYNVPSESGHKSGGATSDASHDPVHGSGSKSDSDERMDLGYEYDNWDVWDDPLDNDNLESHENSNTCNPCSEKDIEILRLKNRIKILEKKCTIKGTSHALKTQQFSHTQLVTDHKIRFYTGLPNRDMFDALFTLLEHAASTLRYWNGPKTVSTVVKRRYKITPKRSKGRGLSAKDEFLMTLMRLRLGLLEEDLSDRFGITVGSCSKILTTWIKFLSKSLGKLIFVPPKEVVFENLPKQFKAFPRVKHILDCSEVFIERPQDPVIQTTTWSCYKHHNTAKFLISITPNGHIQFVSNAWGGRMTDRYITQQSGFLDTLEPYEEVMADRGFSIQEDLAQKLCYLHIPPPRKGREQMTPAEVKKTKAIANTRIFVEQAIQRLKTFRILKYELPITVIPQVDDILTICGALCNLRSPLCS